MRLYVSAKKCRTYKTDECKQMIEPKSVYFMCLHFASPKQEITERMIKVYTFVFIRSFQKK
jgi:hypothetical protein